jgi:hypothetical protein
MSFALRRIVAALTLVSAGLAAASAAEENTAEGLVREMWRRYRSAGSEREELDILVLSRVAAEPLRRDDVRRLLDEGGDGVVRKRALRHASYAADERDKLRIVFSLPADDAGTTYLVWRAAAGEVDEQWMFLPGLGTERRIPASSSATFAGTNFSYEDLRDMIAPPSERFAYTIEGAEEVGGRACTIVRAAVKKPGDSAYAWRKLWIDTERAFPLRIEYFDRTGSLWKVLVSSDVVPVANGVHRSDLVEMRDVQANETTILSVRERSIGLPLDPELFSRESLRRAGRRD